MTYAGIPASMLPLSSTAEEYIALARNSDGVIDIVRVNASALHGIYPQKPAVRALTTDNVDLAATARVGYNFGGVQLVAGDHIAKAYGGAGGAADNGVYVVSPSGGPARRADFNVSANILGGSFAVTHGTYAGTTWGVMNVEAISLGVTPILIQKINAYDMSAMDLARAEAVTARNEATAAAQSAGVSATLADDDAAQTALDRAQSEINAAAAAVNASLAVAAAEASGAVDFYPTRGDARIWNYSSSAYAASLSIAAQELMPQSIAFRDDGLRMYIAGAIGDDITEYVMATPWDIATATPSTTYSIAAQETYVTGVYVRPDGLGFYVVGATNKTVYEYAMSTAWDISTSAYSGRSLAATAQDATPRCIEFSPDGLRMWVVGYSNRTVYEYDLTTAWNLSTAVYTGRNLSVAAQELSPSCARVTRDGRKMLVQGVNGDKINSYMLTTPRDITTAAYVDAVSIVAQDGNMGGFAIRPDGEHLFATGPTNDMVYKYVVPSALANGTRIEISADESQGGQPARYIVEAGALKLLRLLPRVVRAPVTFAVPGQFPTVAAAYAAAGAIIAADAQVTIEVSGHVTVAADAILETSDPYSSRIRLVGARSKLTRTIAASGHTVTGGAGAWSVTMKLDAVADIAVGDVVKIVSPRDDDAYLFWGLEAAESKNGGRLTASGTDLTLTSQSVDLLTTSHKIFFKGEGRDITAKATATSLTISAPFNSSPVAAPYWETIKRAPGTVGTGSALLTTVTGVGTTFTDYSVGDVLVTNRGLRRITAISSSTSLTVEHAITLAAGETFGVHRMSDAHMGAFVITAVNTANSTITYVNKVASSRVMLSAKQLRGGTVEIIRDTLSNSQVASPGVMAGRGIVNGGYSLALIDRLALIGSQDATSYGLDDGYESIGGGGIFNLGDDMAIVDWGVAIRNYFGVVHGNYVAIGNCTGAYAVWNYQGTLNMRYARISCGLATYGLFRGAGSSSYASNWYIVGSQSYADYATSGAHLYADGMRAIGPQGVGFYDLSSSGGHRVESKVWCPGSIGISLNAGGGGRFAGSRVYCGASVGIVLANYTGEGAFAWVNGCASIGYSMSGFRGTLDDAVATSNGGVAYSAQNGSRVEAARAFALYGGARGFYVLSGSKVQAEASYSIGNAVADYAASGLGSHLAVDGPISGASVYSHPRNTQIGGAWMLDSALGAPTQLTVLAGTMAVDFGAIAAHSYASAAIVVAGAKLRDGAHVKPPSLANPGLIFEGVVTGADTLEVVARNITAASIDPANTTFGYQVQQAA